MVRYCNFGRYSLPDVQLIKPNGWLINSGLRVLSLLRAVLADPENYEWRTFDNFDDVPQSFCGIETLTVA
mgnify:CR=1 FL=1